MIHLVYFSGGIGSWAAAKRVAERHGTDDLVLLFADTSMEDEDLYRFLDEAAANVGGKLVILKDGRTPWEVFKDKRFIGNSRVDPCSLILKRDLLNKWRTDRYEPDECVSYIGIDWTEEHRLERLRPRMAPYRVEAPLCERPLLTKAQMLAWASSEGLKPPRLYDLGFPHNNCGGFCVKAGQAHFKHLLEVMPERYSRHEGEEEALRAHLEKNISIMRDRRNGTSKPLTMREFRERIQGGNTKQLDLFEWGGCGCAVD